LRSICATWGLESWASISRMEVVTSAARLVTSAIGIEAGGGGV
jgi:hypothetical protein